MKTLKKRTSVIAVVLMLVMALSATSVFATDPGSYDGYARKLSDLLSDPVKKVGTTSACYTVTRYEGDGECAFWVENSSGTNITEKKISSTTHRKKLMNYTSSASYYVGKYVHLCISTNWGTFNSQYVKGLWSPDNLLSIK